MVSFRNNIAGRENGCRSYRSVGRIEQRATFQKSDPQIRWITPDDESRSEIGHAPVIHEHNEGVARIMGDLEIRFPLVEPRYSCAMIRFHPQSRLRVEFDARAIREYYGAMAPNARRVNDFIRTEKFGHNEVSDHRDNRQYAGQRCQKRTRMFQIRQARLGGLQIPENT